MGHHHLGGFPLQNIHKFYNSMKLPLSAQIEAILFFKTDAVSIRALSELLGAPKSEVEKALLELAEAMNARGVSLSRIGDEVMLATAQEMASLIEKISKEEREGELSKASMETLSIILYKNGSTKSEIDYIRGVNSSFILRALQVRGLIERKNNPNDNRSFIYTPTFDLYNYLGVSKKEELPEYDQLMNELKNLTDAENKEETAS